MSTLSTQQRATLRTAIQANATANPFLIAGDTVSLLAWCNSAASPAQFGWRTNVPATDSDSAPSYSAFDSIAAGKRESWGFFLGFSRDFTKQKVRNWITDVWGNATAGSNAESILQAGTENATNAQVVFGGNVKSTGTVSALDRSYIGQVDQDDVNRIVAGT